MHRLARFALIAAVVQIAGCQSHEAKIDSLQKEHERLSQQYQKDCGSEYMKAKPEFSQKCQDEAKQMDDVWKKLQAERGSNR
jgi:outer membrane murein-binding lipoprotein Lpp